MMSRGASQNGSVRGLSPKNSVHDVPHPTVSDGFVNTDFLSENSHLHGGRTRHCTEAGKEFFLAEGQKNRSRCRKTILKRVQQVEDLLQCGNLQEANKIHESLSETFEEFVQAHVRCQELLGPDANQDNETQLLEEVKGLMTRVEGEVSAATWKVTQEVRLTHRLRRHDEIGILIQQIEGFLDENELEKANSSLIVLNETVAEYIMYSEAKEPEEERRLSDEILSQVTRVREKVASAINSQDLSNIRRRSEVRQSLYGDIQEKIVEIENHIQDGNLQQADTAVADLDNIFSEFMSTSCVPVTEQDECHSTKSQGFRWQEISLFSEKSTQCSQQNLK